MLLGEMRPLPERAGQARIRFVSTPFAATRIDEHIRLPYGGQNPFSSLRGGRQFLYRDVQTEQWLREDPELATMMEAMETSFMMPPVKLPDSDTRIYFGGTDERPFLTELKLEPFQAFVEGGEEAFFDSLVPPRIKLISKRLGTQPRRQGDIWALPLPSDWQDGMAEILDLPSLPVVHKTVQFPTERLPLCGGRHRLSGAIHRIRVVNGHIAVDQGVESLAAATSSRGNLLVAMGRIEAPDHKPLELARPHLLGQTPHLLRRFQAD